MNEVDFRKWLIVNGIPKKIQSDYISRIKRIERNLQIDIDEQYSVDYCESLLRLFDNKGINPEMKKHGVIELPIGKYYLSTYRLVVNKYLQFRHEINTVV